MQIPLTHFCHVLYFSKESPIFGMKTYRKSRQFLIQLPNYEDNIRSFRPPANNLPYFVAKFRRVKKSSRTVAKCDWSLCARAKCDWSICDRAKCDWTICARAKRDWSLCACAKCDWSLCSGAKCDWSLCSRAKCDWPLCARAKGDWSLSTRAKCDWSLCTRAKCDWSIIIIIIYLFNLGIHKK